MFWDAVLIAGPTASGKSALALALAERFGGTVINADSMQVYAELRVLTARPHADDEARAPHRLYGHVPVAQRYSAGRYQDDAAKVLEEARRAGRLPIFVGGTGLYFRVLTDGLSPIPAVPAEIAAAMRERLAEQGLEEFFTAFAERDPEMAARLQPCDSQRVLRAASVLESSGRSLAVWQRAAGAPVLGEGNIARFVIAPPRDVLYRRIDTRFADMVCDGGLEEARMMADLDPALPAARALGIPPLLAHLAGTLALDAAIAQGQAETRHYAKRQMTWLRRFMKDWIWLENADSGHIMSLMMEKNA